MVCAGLSNIVMGVRMEQLIAWLCCGIMPGDANHVHDLEFEREERLAHSPM